MLRLAGDLSDLVGRETRLEPRINAAILRLMTSAFATEISRLTKRQKLALADRLLAETGVHHPPPAIRTSHDPRLPAELRRRLSEKTPGAWLTLDEFKARHGIDK